MDNQQEMDVQQQQSTSHQITSDISESMFISPYDILQYFSGSKRPIREGTELLNAGWVHAIGIVPPLVKNRVMGLVVQTSSISSKPHEVKLDFLKQGNKRWKCVCTCKAGSGEKCKHIAACLLHINRYPNLGIISCTDIKQKWGKTGKSIAKQYSSVCTTEMCHVRKKICIRDEAVTEDQQDAFRLKFINASPHSGLAKTLSTHRTLQNTPIASRSCRQYPREH